MAYAVEPKYSNGSNTKNPIMQTSEDFDLGSYTNLPGSAKWWNESLFPDKPNPANVAMPYLDQIEGYAREGYSPYINAGQQAMPRVMDAYGQQMDDPTAIMRQIGSGYQESPGYQFQRNQSLDAANRSAAAGGMLGTPANQFDSMEIANQLANQDYQNYLGMGLNQYQSGLQGMQGINQMGYNASDAQTNAIMSALLSKANLAYAGQANQNQQQSGFGAVLGGIAGGYMGGPKGAAVGSGIGGGMF